MSDFGGNSYPYEGELTQDEKTWGLIAHLSPLVGYIIVFSFLGPLIVWAIKKDQSEFVRKAALEALAFNIGMFVIAVILVIITFVTCGIGGILLLPFAIYNILMMVMGAIRANEGKVFEYPVTSQFVK